MVEVDVLAALMLDQLDSLAQDGQVRQAEEVEFEQAERLDAAQVAIWRRVIKGDDKAIDRLLGIMKRRMELFGLAAPRRQEFSGLIATLSARDLNLKGLSAA